MPSSRGQYIALHVRCGDVADCHPVDGAFDQTHKRAAHWLSDLVRNPLNIDAYEGFREELANRRFGRSTWGQAPVTTDTIQNLVNEVRNRHGDLPIVIVGLVPESHPLRSILPHATFATRGSEWQHMRLLANAKVVCLAHSYLGLVGALLADTHQSVVYYPMNGMFACLGLGSIVDRSGWQAYDSLGTVVDPADWQAWQR